MKEEKLRKLHYEKLHNLHQNKILNVVKLERMRDWTCTTHVETTYIHTQSEEIKHMYGASTHRKGDLKLILEK